MYTIQSKKKNKHRGNESYALDFNNSIPIEIADLTSFNRVKLWRKIWNYICNEQIRNKKWKKKWTEKNNNNNIVAVRFSFHLSSQTHT